MAWVGSTVTAQVVTLLNAPQGLNACVATLAQAENTTLAPLGQNQILAQNVSIELTERSTDVTYPSVKRVLRENRQPAQGEVSRTSPV
jgi:hypothetical protein